MSEIFSAIKLKNKITIVSSMAAFAVLLATAIGILTFVTADRHTHVYDYALEMGNDGSFDLTGICKVDNCESPYYREKDVSGVKLLSAVSPTCTKAGNRVYTYTYKGVTVKYTEELPKVAHHYNFEIVTNNDVIYLNGKCNVSGCEDPYIFVSNIEEIKLVSTVPGTCFSPRKETYIYTVGGQEYSFVTLVEEDIPHTLNGIPANSYADKEGKYPIGIPGIKLFDNKKLACGATSDGYYICQICKQIESVKVFRPEHEFLYSEDNVKAPTPSNNGAGLVTLICHNTECTEKVEVVLPPLAVGENAFVISEATELHSQVVRYSFVSTLYGFKFEKDYEIGEPLSHDYRYQLVPDENNTGKLDLLGICSQPECQTPEIRTKDVPAVFVEDTSTCLVPGFVIWSYEHNGEMLYFEAIAEDTADHSYAYDEDEADHPSLTKTGSIQLHCSTDGCDHTVTVELPKVVIGENAVYVAETEIGTVYEYSYKSEYNCTIVLNVIVYNK